MNIAVLFLILVIVPAGITCLAFVIMNAVSTHKNKKLHKEHPWYFQKLDELNDLVHMSMSIHNREISPRKRLIDGILKEWDYLPQELRERKQRELESYRRMIAEYQVECDNLDNKVQSIRNELREYNKIHHLYKEYE